VALIACARCSRCLTKLSFKVSIKYRRCYLFGGESRMALYLVHGMHFPRKTLREVLKS
jgi:hypothetical protein